MAPGLEGLSVFLKRLKQKRERYLERHEGEISSDRTSPLEQQPKLLIWACWKPALSFTIFLELVVWVLQNGRFMGPNSLRVFA